MSVTSWYWNIKTEKEFSKLNNETEIHTKIENIDLGVKMDIHKIYIKESTFLYRQSSKGASYVKTRIENQAKIFIKNKDRLCGTDSVLVSLHFQRQNPISLNTNRNIVHAIETNGIDLLDGLKVHDIEKPEELNNLKMNVFELNNHKTLTLPDVTKYMKKNVEQNENTD